MRKHHKLRATSQTWSVVALSLPCLCPPLCSHSTLTRAGASPSPTFPDPASSLTHGQEFPLALVLKFQYHTQPFLPKLFTPRNTDCTMAFDNTDSCLNTMHLKTVKGHFTKVRQRDLKTHFLGVWAGAAAAGKGHYRPAWGLSPSPR